MLNVVTASNSEVLRLLGSRACGRLALSRIVVRTGLEALEAVGRLRPPIAILDLDMPELDGLEVCRRIKLDPATRGCRVMLVVAGIITRATIDHLAEAGCDDVLVMPAISEEFFSHLADLLGVPRRRSRRVRVELLAQVEHGEKAYPGQVEDLSQSGARVRLEQPLGPLDLVRVRLDHPQGAAVAAGDARVVWRKDAGRLIGLHFTSMTARAIDQLQSLTLWEVVEEEELTRVFLEGDIVEATSFADLAGRLAGVVEFDAAGVRYINSQGTRRWVGFLEGLSGVTDYWFSRCSVAFTTQASLLVEFLGRGRIVSFMAPYHCDDCDHDEYRLLQSSAVVEDGNAATPPRFRCPSCGGHLVFDEVPERYFAFLGRP